MGPPAEERGRDETHHKAVLASLERGDGPQEVWRKYLDGRIVNMGLGPPAAATEVLKLRFVIPLIDRYSLGTATTAPVESVFSMCAYGTPKGRHPFPYFPVSLFPHFPISPFPYFSVSPLESEASFSRES